jgi:hypothetical protein
MLATSLFIAYRQHNMPLPMAEVCKLLCDDLSVVCAIKYLNQAVELLFPTSKPPSPSADFKKPRGTGTLMTRWCDELGIRDQRIHRRCEEVAKILHQKNPKHKPRVIAAGAVLLVGKSEGLDAAAVADVSSVSSTLVQAVISPKSSTTTGRTSRKAKPSGGVKKLLKKKHVGQRTSDSRIRQ